MTISLYLPGFFLDGVPYLLQYFEKNAHTHKTTICKANSIGHGCVACGMPSKYFEGKPRRLLDRRFNWMYGVSVNINQTNSLKKLCSQKCDCKGNAHNCAEYDRTSRARCRCQDPSTVYGSNQSRPPNLSGQTKN